MTLSNLRNKYKFLQDVKISKLNSEIFDYVSKFSNDENLLVASLIVQPNGLIRKRKDYDSELSRILFTFDRLQKCDRSLIKHKKGISLEESKILFLSYYMKVLDKQGTSRKEVPVLNKRKLQYIMDILQSLQSYTFQDDLDDIIFSLLSPKVYGDYIKLRKLSEAAYEKNRQEIIKTMKDNFKGTGIKAEIQTRLKTIYSIHSKILRKNTLYSQVFDVMGFRIITANSEDCYRVLSQFLYKWDVISSKVKDFIAMPKENGYQSIHLTVFYKDFPIEVQIRSEKMNQFAEFGKASHQVYKHGK